MRCDITKPKIKSYPSLDRAIFLLNQHNFTETCQVIHIYLNKFAFADLLSVLWCVRKLDLGCCSCCRPLCFYPGGIISSFLIWSAHSVLTSALNYGLMVCALPASLTDHCWSLWTVALVSADFCHPQFIIPSAFMVISPSKSLYPLNCVLTVLW